MFTSSSFYRLHPTKKSKVKSSDIFAEFDKLSSISDEIIIPGDYNIHWDKTTETETKHLVELLHSANMVQYVKEITHISARIIDLVVKREGQNIVVNLHVSSMLSDHFVVQADLRISRPRPQEKTVSYLKYDAINMDDFSNELIKSWLITDPSEALETWWININDSLKRLLDKHVPLKISVPLYHSTIRLFKQQNVIEGEWNGCGV